MVNSRFTLALTVSVFAALTGIPLAGPADAAAPLLTCDETGKVRWDAPGIGDSPAKIHWTDEITFTNCTGTAVDKGLPIPKSETDDGTETASCGQETTDNTSTGTITWSFGEDSKVSSGGHAKHNKHKKSRPGVFPTRIDTGNYKGKSATDSNTVTSEQPCPGVTSATLVGTFTITS
ncbi:hypothetical protein [Nocardia pseudobrasiliensis]|uniref:Ig-like domain-containing protein n=1 Tax=Nocardia pseudobrasiliensis TaxID=45979 RepID=A0A370I519_9NOCA|nr:hypothetical protein [Nocardia pseudobrasiliensis]RDI65838.1 hypothetical protein DFR76_105154 [Nocardia pseudobrasiliensis]